MNNSLLVVGHEMFSDRKAASSYTWSKWKQQFYQDYRRLVIQNHFHKCTKSCYKKNAKKGKRGCRFGCFHVELEKDNTVEPPSKKLKYCSGWPRSKQAHFVRISQEDDSDAAMEDTKNELSHVLQMQRDHPFEGSSNPVAQVTLRCNVDVKYLGRGIATEDLELLGQSIDAKRAATTLYQLLVDMTRDMQDVQWYTGEYAAKKFELSRDMLPELYAGVKRLEEEDAQRPPQVSADRLPLTVTQGQALKILRRLAFAMQRCVSKANNELAYQVLYEQEQYVTYQTYDVFMGYVYMSMHDARRMELEELKNQHPNLVVRSLLVQTDSQTTEEEQWVSLDTMAEVEVLQDSVMEAAAAQGPKQHGHAIVTGANQKDDFLHRGSHVLLSSLSFFMYGRHVRRVSRKQAGRVDYVRYFPFCERYVLFNEYVQASC